MIKNKLLILILLININYIYCGTKNYLLMMLNNIFEQKSIKKEQVLNNEQIEHLPHLRFRNFIIKVHHNIENMPSDHRKLNQKLFETILARKSLTYEELINYKNNEKKTK